MGAVEDTLIVDIIGSFFVFFSFGEGVGLGGG